MANKNNDDLLINKANNIIGKLANRNNKKLNKLYNYYNGIRDAEEFAYLENNFGVGSPSTIDFTPLIRKHINFLIGDLLESPVIAKINCTDEETISKIEIEKDETMNKAVMAILKKNLISNINKFLNGDEIQDEDSEGTISSEIELIKNSFVSQYEIATQHVVDYIIQNNITSDVRERLMLDLLVSGMLFFNIITTPSGDNFEIRIYDPRNVYVEKNRQSNIVSEACNKAVIKRKLTIDEIMNEYGEHLTSDQIENIINKFDILHGNYSDNSNVEVINGLLNESSMNISGYEKSIDNDTYVDATTLTVYDTEWIEYEVVKNSRPKAYLRKVVKIASDIWIIYDSESITHRSADNPYGTRISLNGIFFSNRSNKPISLVEDCIKLQDKYDIISYFRDNVIANSGTKGDWIDMQMIPTWLGNDEGERFLKWQAYKKAGWALIDPSMTDTPYQLNTTFGGYDDTLSVNTIQAFNLALTDLEQTMSSITGVFREMLNGIQTKDAVSNVKVGQKNSFTITKIFFNAADKITELMLEDGVAKGKNLWKKKGLKGSLVLGDNYKEIFTADSVYFSNSYYKINLTSSSKILKDIEDIKMLVFQLIQSGSIDMDITLEAITATSLTELKYKVKQNLIKNNGKDQQLQDLVGKLEEAQNNIQQTSEQLKEAQSEYQKLVKENERLTEQYNKNKNEIEWFKAKSEKEYKDKLIEIENTRTKIEISQLSDGNNKNDKIKRIL